MQLKSIIILWCFLFLQSAAKADEIFEDYLSIRALGMGNAYTPIVDNVDALFYNPAGLANIEGINLSILDLWAALNGVDAYEEYQDFGDISFAEQIQRLFGQRLWIGLGVKSAISFPGFAAAVYNANQLGFYLSNPAYPNLFVKFGSDIGASAGVGFYLIPKILSFGLSVSRITRIGSQIPIGPSIIGTLSDEDLRDELNKTGTGFGANSGLQLRFPGPVTPILAVSWKNMGMTKFTAAEDASAPPRAEQEIIYGIGAKIDLPLITISPVFDYKHSNLASEQVGKKIHLGIEFDLPLIDIRAGLHQGYYTLGAGVDLGIVRVEAATWGVEMGVYPGQQEDRRVAVQASIELSLDPDFGGIFGGQKGAGRPRVKQRR